MATLVQHPLWSNILHLMILRAMLFLLMELILDSDDM